MTEATTNTPNPDAVALTETGQSLTTYVHPSPLAEAIGNNPFVKEKEKALDTITDQRFSMRRSCAIRPERGRLIVARIKADDNIGSIMKPEERKGVETALNMEVVVLTVGEPRLLDNGATVPTSAKPGRHAVIRQHAGTEFDWWDEFGKQYSVLIVGQSEILAWLDPISGQPDINAELRRTLESIGADVEPTP